MYRRILVALENGAADEALIPHVSRLAQLCGAQLLASLATWGVAWWLSVARRRMARAVMPGRRWKNCCRCG